MKGKTGILKKFITSIYDINVFSEYAKEGIVKAIVYILIVCSGLGIIKGGILGYKINLGVNSITRYLQSNGRNIEIENGLLKLDSNIPNIYNYIYLDNDRTINQDIDYKGIFYNDKIDLLILKDGIAFNNYGSIYTLKYNDIFKSNDVDSEIVIKKTNSFSYLIIGIIIVVNIIELVKDLAINYFIIVTAALLVSIFMKMIVKYKALWSLVIYSSTFPLTILIILNILKPNINFDFTFIGGNLVYIILTLRHIKDEIIQKLSKGNLK